MNGTIYDFSGLPRVAALGPDALPWPPRERARRWAPASAPERVGLISNPRSHRNSTVALAGSDPRPGVVAAAPRTRAELRDVLTRFAEERIDLLVIDGGDGTVRDVLTCAGDVWGARWPRLAVLPSGKTNALAIDLGTPKEWTLDQALAAARDGGTTSRAPVVVERRDGADGAVRGFLFGAGAFVGATALAQRTHRAGAFNGVAVGLALSWAVAQTFFGSPSGEWRRGERMRVRHHERSAPMHDAALASDRASYLFLASTLERLPLGVRPFGSSRPGLKTLAIDAPPRRMLSAVGPLLGGSEAAWLERAGYHRVDAPSLDLDLDGEFILDGERFPAGRYRISEGVPLNFVTP
ncbi:diacylglycerol/lipid kinase family protein [Sphingomonas lenta]|uniref:diacylglycerol/lipid kinase family protein n=1 Tax=Sphingomonas lenta TaxID=1141887 RepID=UPI0015950DB2|nr:diacylglycerol kinase family protein [Sphingomonas lenta]